MNRTIKVIWEFYGADAELTAKHHKIHLEEFAKKEKLQLEISGVEYVNELQWIAYLLVKENEVLKVRDALKPLRAEIFED